MALPDPLFQQVVLQAGMLTPDLVAQLQARQRELAAEGQIMPLMEIAVTLGFMPPAWSRALGIAQELGWTPPPAGLPPFPIHLFPTQAPASPPANPVAPTATLPSPSAAPPATPPGPVGASDEAGSPATAAPPEPGVAPPTGPPPAAGTPPAPAPTAAAASGGGPQPGEARTPAGLSTANPPSAGASPPSALAAPSPPSAPGAGGPPSPSSLPEAPISSLPPPPPLPAIARLGEGSGPQAPATPAGAVPAPTGIPGAHAAGLAGSRPGASGGSAPVEGALVGAAPAAGAPVGAASAGAAPAAGAPVGAAPAGGAPLGSAPTPEAPGSGTRGQGLRGQGPRRKTKSGSGRLGSGAARRRTATFAAPSDLDRTPRKGNAGYLALATAGAAALGLAILGAAFLLKPANPQSAQATPSVTPTATVPERSDERWLELANEEIRRAREELRLGDAEAGRKRLQRCMALLKEKPDSKAARLTLFEALEKFPAPESDPGPEPEASKPPSGIDEFLTEDRTTRDHESREDEIEAEDDEENPLALEDDPRDPVSVTPAVPKPPVPKPPVPQPTGSEPGEEPEEAPPEVRDALETLKSARLWLVAVEAFDRSDRLGLEKVVAQITKQDPTSVYARGGKGLLAFLHEDFVGSRTALEPLHSDPKLREASEEAGLLRPALVLVRVAFYTKHYDLARSVAQGLKVPSERRLWTLLVDGPFASEFPHLYPALTTLSPDGRYRVVSDVGITGSELDRLEAEVASAPSPAAQDARRRKIRKSHKLLGTIAEVLDKASLAYGKLLSDSKGKAVFPTVYVFKDRAGFAKFGRDIGCGSTENALGYYMPGYRILVFYEETEDVKLGLSRNTVETLLHETFHQWIHLHLEDVPPWFNEGMAEYFSLGAKIGRKSLEYALLPQRNPSRLTNIRDALRGEYAKPWPLRDLIRADQRAFMTPGQAAVNYAHAWSFVHYLGATPKRRRLLRSYFRALLAGHDSHAAYAKVFGRLDMNAMQAEWKHYTLTVK